MSEFLVATMVRVIKKSGKLRVSRDAAIELGVLLEEYALMVSKGAIKLAERRGVKTLSKEDIKAAAAAVSK